MKDWNYRKSVVRREKAFPAKDQEKFILDAIRYKDQEGIRLALEGNFNFNIMNKKGELIWFDLAKNVLNP